MYMSISTRAPAFHIFNECNALIGIVIGRTFGKPVLHPVPWNTTSKKILPHCTVVQLGAIAIRVDIRERRRRDLECKVMLASVLAENPKEFHRNHKLLCFYWQTHKYVGIILIRHTVFPYIVAPLTILFWKLECGKYSRNETTQWR